MQPYLKISTRISGYTIFELLLYGLLIAVGIYYIMNPHKFEVVDNRVSKTKIDLSTQTIQIIFSFVLIAAGLLFLNVILKRIRKKSVVIDFRGASFYEYRKIKRHYSWSEINSFQTDILYYRNAATGANLSFTLVNNSKVKFKYVLIDHRTSGRLAFEIPLWKNKNNLLEKQVSNLEAFINMKIERA